MMLYIEVKNNTVENVICSDKTQEKLIHIPDDCPATVGHDVRWYDDKWKRRSLQALVDEELITLADDEKIEGDQVVKKTRYDQAVDGDIELQEFEYLDHDEKQIKVGTPKELLTLSRITRERYNEIRASLAREQRDRLLLQVDQVASNPLRWADLTQQQQRVIAAYRHALLGIPGQPGFPAEINWPEPPQTITN